MPAFCSHTVPCQMVILKHFLPLSTSEQFLRKFPVSSSPIPTKGNPLRPPFHGAFSKASSTLFRTGKRWLHITKNIMPNSLLYFQSYLPQCLTFNRCSRTLKWNHENTFIYVPPITTCFYNHRIDIALILTLNFSHLISLQYVAVCNKGWLSEWMGGFPYTYFIIEWDIIGHYILLSVALCSWQYLCSRSFGVHF